MSTIDRLTAVDLRGLSEEELRVLRQQAITRGLSFSEYLSRLVGDASRRLVANVERARKKEAPTR